MANVNPGASRDSKRSNRVNVFNRMSEMAWNGLKKGGDERDQAYHIARTLMIEPDLPIQLRAVANLILAHDETSGSYVEYAEEAVALFEEIVEDLGEEQRVYSMNGWNAIKKLQSHAKLMLTKTKDFRANYELDSSSKVGEHIEQNDGQSVHEQIGDAGAKRVAEMVEAMEGDFDFDAYDGPSDYERRFEFVPIHEGDPSDGTPAASSQTGPTS
jgi:hypothetical protein